MKILFISRLRYRPQSGPTYSVPEQILSLSELEEVLWVNIEQSPCEIWNRLSFYVGAKEGLRLRDLPGGFASPDLVVYQCLYHLKPCHLVFDVWRHKVPYIIVPRSALTAKAQLKSRLKKDLGNFLFYRRFVRKASAVQFLTEQERVDSGERWNSRGIVLPNGISGHTEVNHRFRSSNRHILFIGRYEPYQKGLDVLVEAIKVAENELRTYGVVVNMYGSDVSNAAKDIHSWIAEKGIGDIVCMESEAFGDKKRAALLDADAFIMASRYEGMPMGLLEALSYGLPCIVTPGTNMSLEVESSVAGWTCECTAESVAKALVSFAKAKDLTTRSANAVRLSARYEWPAIARETAKVYGEIVRGY